MTGYELYVFVLCLIVFTLLTAMFTYLIFSITKMELALIGYGHRDKAIKKAIEKERKQRADHAKLWTWVDRITSLLLCLLFLTTFAFAVYVHTAEDRPANGIPSIKVVKSESMATKHAENKYLFANHLDDQFQMFDIIICRHLPPEEELALYDIVVYKLEDMYVIHRIVGIEEPNADHPNERYFILQGDAVPQRDTLPVRYSQMRGIYEGTRIPFAGSFVLFLQSPAGWLCVLLVVCTTLATPFVEKRLKRETDKRTAFFAAEADAKPTADPLTDMVTPVEGGIVETPTDPSTPPSDEPSAQEQPQEVSECTEQ